MRQTQVLVLGALGVLVPAGLALPQTMGKRASHDIYGLLDQSKTKHLNDIALGWLPDFEAPEAVKTINDALSKPMAIIGDYVQIYANEETGKPDRPPLAQIDWHLKNVSTDDPETQPVYMLSVMPMDGFDAVTPEVIGVMVAKMKELNDDGITVWLRYAHEFNLDPSESCKYWGQPEAFKKSWIAMHDAIKAGGASKTHMLWSPNIDVNNPPNYMDYYPGDEYIRLHGCSLYPFHLGGREQNNVLKEGGDEFAKLLTPFYSLFGEYPVVISETSNPYNYELNTESPLPGTAQGKEAETKLAWFKQLSSPATAKAFPSIVAVLWFEYLKAENGLTADFRSLTGAADVKEKVMDYLNSQ